MRWLGISIAVLIGIGLAWAGVIAWQFDEQNFVDDKTTAEYTDRMIPLWPDDAVPEYMAAAYSPANWPWYIKFWKQDDYELKPYMLNYPAKGPGPHPAVLIFPGGGYLFRSEKHEGIKMARWLNSLGISAFVVNYRLIPYTHPVPLHDAQQAMRLVHANAARWHIDPVRIGVLGFSAGGHLAGLVSTFGQGETRPAFALLAYGVLAPEKFPMGDLGGRMNVPAEDISPLAHIGPNTPPAFLWHTKEDPIVPYQHSVLYHEALVANGIASTLVLFETGTHGLGLAEDHAEAHAWPQQAEDWLRAQDIIADR